MKAMPSQTIPFQVAKFEQRAIRAALHAVEGDIIEAWVCHRLGATTSR